MNVSDRLLLRKRAIIETVNDELKNIAQVEHSDIDALTISSSTYQGLLLPIVCFQRSRASMYKGPLIHSLLCYEFVELTLVYIIFPVKCPYFFVKMSVLFRQNVRTFSSKCPYLFSKMSVPFYGRVGNDDFDLKRFTPKSLIFLFDSILKVCNLLPSYLCSYKTKRKVTIGDLCKIKQSILLLILLFFSVLFRILAL